MFKKIKTGTVEKILKDLRIKKFGFDGTNIKIRCVNPHHIDKNPSCYIHIKTGIWHCFSCEAKGNLHILLKMFGRSDLIERYLGVGHADIKDYVKELLKMGIEEEENVEEKPVKLPEGFSRKFGKGKGLRYLKRLLYRGLEWRTIKHFALGYCNKHGNMYKRIIIPIYECGKLVGYQGRTIKENETRKYKFPKGMKIGETLYNIDNVRGKTVIICEGPFEVMTLWQWGYKDSVAIFGLNFNPKKIRKLLLAGIDNLVFALDGDNAADEALTKMYKETFPFFNNIYRIKMPRGKDVDDLDPYEFKEIYDDKRKIKKRECDVRIN